MKDRKEIFYSIMFNGQRFLENRADFMNIPYPVLESSFNGILFILHVTPAWSLSGISYTIKLHIS